MAGSAAIVLVLLIVIAVLLVYVLTLAKAAGDAEDDAEMWKDACLSEAELLTQSRANHTALKIAHAELQADYLTQGRRLTIADAKVRAAERELA